MKKLCILILSLASVVPVFAQTKTVTNADLEKFRQKRLEAERQLREKYAEMGFPSPEEREKQNARQRAELEEVSERFRRERLEAQNDIIAEANALRSEIASIDGQINYLRGLTDGKTYKGGTLTTPFAYSFGYGGYRGGFRGGRSPLRQISRLPQNMRTVQEYASMYPSSQSIYNQNTGNVRTGGGRIGYGRRGSYGGGYVAPVIIGGDYYDTNDVNSQIVYLEQQRAGLFAEWQLLEERARRAGIRLD